MDACLGLPMGTACLSIPYWERLGKHQDEALGDVLQLMRQKIMRPRARSTSYHLDSIENYFSIATVETETQR